MPQLSGYAERHNSIDAVVLGIQTLSLSQSRRRKCPACPLHFFLAKLYALSFPQLEHATIKTSSYAICHNAPNQSYANLEKSVTNTSISSKYPVSHSVSDMPLDQLWYVVSRS